MQLRARSFAVIDEAVYIGVTEIGRKSDKTCGGNVFRAGVTIAVN